MSTTEAIRRLRQVLRRQHKALATEDRHLNAAGGTRNDLLEGSGEHRTSNIEHRTSNIELSTFSFQRSTLNLRSRGQRAKCKANTEPRTLNLEPCLEARAARS